MSNTIDRILDDFAGFDPNQDGDPAINRISLVDFETFNESIPGDARLVLVLVEHRLLAPLAGAPDLLPRLKRLKGDLRAEGLHSRFLDLDVYAKGIHQDGRTLLAMRAFLAQAKANQPALEGALLIGSFPEATLVRRAIWKADFDVTIAGIAYQNTPYLAIEPELIAGRSEIVLADLNGAWDDLYHYATTDLDSLRALPDATTIHQGWPRHNRVFASTAFDQTTVSYRDFFYIDDADVTDLGSTPNHLRLLIRHPRHNPEVTAADRSCPNPIARPDILVSRINARAVAVNPKPSIVGTDGNRPLDADGVPQSFESPNNYTNHSTLFSRDPLLERRVLCDYLDRNHRQRIGAFGHLPHRASAIGYELSAADGAGHLAPASDDFGTPLIREDASLLAYVRWLKEPASLRFIHAHSSAVSSSFGDDYPLGDLESETGGPPFRWVRNGTTYTPGFDDQGGTADLYLHRTLWEGGVLADAGQSLVIHGGCKANTPKATQSLMYQQEGYAAWQNAEGVLFYTNTLAVVARAKVFNDMATGFPGGLGQSDRARFGDGWHATYDHDSMDPALGRFEQSVNAKRAYFWSMLGDWTLRLRYRNGLGILGLEDDALTARAVHPDQAWIEGWNFSTAASHVALVADLDGDGQAEVVLTSDWGLGVVKRDGPRWRAVLTAPKGTAFDGWRISGHGGDRWRTAGYIKGRDGKDAVVTSAWGIGVLSLIGDTFQAPIVRPNGTRFGDWMYDSRATRIAAVGEMTGRGRAEMVVFSTWGIGILRSLGSTFDSVTLAARGTSLGGWRINSLQDHTHGLADLDGDGKDELVISSVWGLGILKLEDAGLTAVAMVPHGTDIDGFRLSYPVRILAMGRFTNPNDMSGLLQDRDRFGRHEHTLPGRGRRPFGPGRRPTTPDVVPATMVIADAEGLHHLALKDGRLTRTAFWPQGTTKNGWFLDTRHSGASLIGDMTGDGRDQMLMRSPWAMAILGLSGDDFVCGPEVGFGSPIGDWRLFSSDHVVGVGPLSDPDAGAELLVISRRD
ncbi:hypothetical protein [Thiococcus pfennigii]|uniref:hypothetical protein n=1 Tax=Thiococcus pfennigii TaxID=1057 RepID=UPI00190801D8|nr:hypothetical protein [Thiococcus pfennigii]MBK1732512.1 hypothetical protein [Thiococcus pfennigii]